MSKVGIALLSLFNKIDRIHSFDIRYSLFDIRYSLFNSSFHDQTGCTLAGGRALVKLHFPGVLMQCETQQEPILEPNHNSFFSLT
ncbi:hypothetical protein D1AOALGA4SA_11922 [Olavius algarvensis Delta 1 endosymbiont]|nr:hypothetical protein D1AOALGA4SA_11922 [Olavius algarvensis Delta 1 endosymbiont]